MNVKDFIAKYKNHPILFIGTVQTIVKDIYSGGDIKVSITEDTHSNLSKPPWECYNSLLVVM